MPAPYQRLENSADPETTAWVTAQNELTQAWLATVPTRAAIRSRLGERWNYARFGVPFERGGRWFQARNSGQHPELFGAAIAAALQAAQRTDAPILLRVETSAGYGAAGKPTAKAGDRLAFLDGALGIAPPP